MKKLLVAFTTAWIVIREWVALHSTQNRFDNLILYYYKQFENGCKPCLVLLANLYEEGTNKGKQLNVLSEKVWFQIIRDSFDEGNIKVANSLMVMLMEGNGCEVNYEEAIRVGYLFKWRGGSSIYVEYNQLNAIYLEHSSTDTLDIELANWLLEEIFKLLNRIQEMKIEEDLIEGVVSLSNDVLEYIQN